MARIETGTEARQGSKGKPALYVLVASMILIIAAVAIALTWQGAKAPAEPPTQASGTSTGSNPANSGGAGEAAGNPSTPAPSRPTAQ